MTERVVIIIALFICITIIYVAAIIEDCIVKIKQAEYSRPVNWYVAKNLSGGISKSSGPTPEDPEEYEQIGASVEEKKYEQK